MSRQQREEEEFQMERRKRFSYGRESLWITLLPIWLVFFAIILVIVLGVK